MNFSKVRMQSLLGDLQSIGQGDCLNKAQTLSILNQAFPGAISNAGEVAVRNLLASYNLTFSDSEWVSVFGKFTQAAPSRTLDDWNNHNRNAQQFSKPVSSGDGFTTRT